MWNWADDRPSPPVAIVVGASRGVGQATVLRLAAQGYAVVVGYAHDQSAADSTVDTILAANGAAVAVRADAADELDVERLFAETKDAFGGVDVVVLAVIGDISRRPVSDLELADVDALWRTHGRAAFMVNREAARHLRNGGSIVNLTSSMVGRPLAGYGGYTLSKAAADMLTRVLALELGPRGITVNAVALDVDGACVPDRFVDIVAYLLSEEGRGVTGQVTSVNPWGATGTTP